MKKGITIIAVVLAFVLLITGCSSLTGKSTDTETTTNADANTTLTTPYGARIYSVSDKGIQIYWKCPEGADAYLVERSYSKKGDFEVIIDTGGDPEANESSSKAVYDDDFDQSKEVVYYRVRSYAAGENGETLYSPYTKVLKAKPHKKFSISRTQYYIPSGMTRQIKAYYGWGNAHNLVWTSSDDSVAVVDDDGNVTALRRGECTITCHSKDLDETLSANITVDREPAEVISNIEPQYSLDSNDNDIWKNADSTDSGSAVIMMVGDLMCGGSQIKHQTVSEGVLDFTDVYKYPGPFLSSADFTVGNLETLLASAWPYMSEEGYVDGKPNCNAPETYLAALRILGVDGVCMSNNHNCDGGVPSIIQTVDAVEKYNYAHTGLYRSKDEQQGFIADVNGIKVGFLSYSATRPGFNGKEDNFSQDEQDTYLGFYSKSRAKSDIKDLKSRGAEYIIVYMHWGIKNIFEVTDQQQEIAQELADLGVDYITGGHAHLIQQYDEITSKSGKTVPCLYSLGDFSASISQIVGNRDTVILRIKLERNEDGTISLVENGYIPCYIYPSYNDERNVTMILDKRITGYVYLDNYDAIRARISEEVGDKLSEYEPY